MANKTRQELLDEIPELIKSSGDFQIDKTVGFDLKSIITNIVDSMALNYSYIPVGGIIKWSGFTFNIPANYVLCDGTQGTPALTDRFVVGAGNNYYVSQRGGNSDHTHTGTADNHILSLQELPSHSHEFTRYVQSGSNDGSGGEAAGNFQSKELDYVGGGLPHSHNLSYISPSSALPPYYALAYIMYKG